jgi:hypothetical protein
MDKREQEMEKVGQVKSLLAQIIPQATGSDREKNQTVFGKIYEFWKKENNNSGDYRESWYGMMSIDDFLVMFTSIFEVPISYKTAERLRTIRRLRMYDLTLEEQFALFDRAMGQRETVPYYQTIVCELALGGFHVPEDATDAIELCQLLLRVANREDNLSDEELWASRRIFELLINKAAK